MPALRNELRPRITPPGPVSPPRFPVRIYECKTPEGIPRVLAQKRHQYFFSINPLLRITFCHCELTRQREQISVKLQTLLDLRMDGEVSADEYARKRQELYERQSAIALQLQVSDRDRREIADLAVKAFELSQSLTERWINPHVASMSVNRSSDVVRLSAPRGGAASAWSPGSM